VSVHAADGLLRLHVEDDGLGLKRGGTSSVGVGLSNTATRLGELYGERASFTVGRGTHGGVAVDIGIPLQYAVSESHLAVALGA
jgi:LytS/YehU family sensor histidine kinase